VVQLREVVAFMREFADHCHHSKEKDLLYPACVDHGLQLHGHPMAALLYERQESRQLVDQLADSTEEYVANRATASARLTTTIDAIAKLYLRHIRDEDKVVFPMVKLVLPVETRNRLYAQFEELDARNPLALTSDFSNSPNASPTAACRDAVPNTSNRHSMSRRRLQGRGFTALGMRCSRRRSCAGGEYVRRCTGQSFEVTGLLGWYFAVG
jgi:iron-sulfur cluster repair protein YtfE (RIC family)